MFRTRRSDSLTQWGWSSSGSGGKGCALHVLLLGLIHNARSDPFLLQELDHLRYYCDSCREIVFEETFFCTDLGVQLVV